MVDIYISYSRQDRMLASALAADLNGLGYTTWQHEGLPTGEALPTKDRKELEAAKAVIVIWTEHAVQSKAVHAVAHAAVASDKLIPISVPGFDLQMLPSPFDRLHTGLITNRETLHASLGRKLSAALQSGPTVHRDAANRGTLHASPGRKLSAVLGSTPAVTLDIETAAVSAPEDTEKFSVNAEYVVWYGTNRRPNDAADISKGFSSERDPDVHYGSCRVFIPESHKIGSTGSPWWKRLLTWSDDRLKLLEISSAPASDYWQAISRHLASVAEDDRHAVVFVHGYNVSFEEAALRAAQLGFDLSIKGAMAFFSWPSKGSLKAYPADEAAIDASEQDIADFLTGFAAHSGARSVDIIAHSMGNRGVLRAVDRIAMQAGSRTGVLFNQIILAAPDVDAGVFKKLSAAYKQTAHRTTLYVSARDMAIEASEWLHDYPRAGFLPPVTIVPGIDTVNVTNIDLTTLGHGYIADARAVLQDVHDLILHDSSPDSRFGLLRAETGDGKLYWTIGA
jgi:esterase/lipase superfamily enzyme